jgi:hypothetical protein
MNQLSEPYLKDFAVGQMFGSERLRIDGERALAFAAEFDPQPFHLDEAAAPRSIFGGLAASGWHTDCGDPVAEANWPGLAFWVRQPLVAAQRSQSRFGEDPAQAGPYAATSKAFNAIQASQIESDGRPRARPIGERFRSPATTRLPKRSWRIFSINSGSTSGTLVRLPEGGGSRRTHLPIACRLIPPS